VLLAAAPATAQIGGGSWGLVRQYDGQAAEDQFGGAVARIGDLDGDGFDDLLVGVKYADPAGRQNAGSAYVYSGASGALLFQFDGQAAGDYFGIAVAAAGDVDGDGTDDLIVGAMLADPGGLQQAGSAYVYSGATGQEIHQFDGQASDDVFGCAVAGAGDVDGDGFDDLIVGAELADPGGISQAGSAYVYSGASGALLHRFDGTLGSGAGEFLGGSVDGAGDIDGDGLADLVVGARGALLSGVAYVYSGASGALLLTLPGGTVVSGAGDVDQDGVADLLTSRPYASPGGLSNAGSVFLYSGASGVRLHSYDGVAAGDLFGSSLGNAGDLDDDGSPDLIIGAPAAEPGGRYLAGSAFAYSGATGALLRRFNGLEIGDELGSAVAGAGDVDGDGLADLALGALGSDPGALNRAGSVYLVAVDPYLAPAAPSLSASGGGSLSFAIDFPSSEAGAYYALLASLGGTGPVTLAGLEIPLNADPLFQRTVGATPPTPLQGTRGALDANGDAQAVLFAGPALAPIIGQVVHFAAVSFDLAPLQGRLSSMARTVRILP